VFFHKQELQYKATPDKPDAIYARKLQEVLGGQYGEITVALQYSFQAWNAHIPGKYRDLLFGIGAEEMGHVEMLATMIAQLLEKSPLGITEEAVQSDPAIAAVIGGTDMQHAIVAGAGARAVDSNGNPWQGSYITASGNLLADFTANANAEMQGRLQVARLYRRPRGPGHALLPPGQGHHAPEPVDRGRTGAPGVEDGGTAGAEQLPHQEGTP
jgi:Mn-containing catalase